MRIGPITGSIGESWPLLVPVDEHTVSSPPGRPRGHQIAEFFYGGAVCDRYHLFILVMHHAQGTP
jgi:hypothetical protein